MIGPAGAELVQNGFSSAMMPGGRSEPPAAKVTSALARRSWFGHHRFGNGKLRLRRRRLGRCRHRWGRLGRHRHLPRNPRTRQHGGGCWRCHVPVHYGPVSNFTRRLADFRRRRDNRRRHAGQLIQRRLIDHHLRVCRRQAGHEQAGHKQAGCKQAASEMTANQPAANGCEQQCQDVKSGFHKASLH